jgi:hypothetical protein
MPIKGKGKGARRRTVAAGPKRGYVEPPKPFWRKRGFWFAVAAVVGVILAAVLPPVFIHLGNVSRQHDAAAKRNAERDRARAVVTHYRAQVVDSLDGLVQAFADTVVPLPDLSQGAQKLKPGEDVPADFVQLAQDKAAATADALTALGKIDVSTRVSGHPSLGPLIDAQHEIVDSLQVYQNAADLFVQASKSDGDVRDGLVEDATALVTTGQTLFTDGFQKITNVFADLKVPLPQAPLTPPTPSPSPSASPTTSASPTPSASTASPAPSPSPTKHTKSPTASPSPTKHRKKKH